MLIEISFLLLWWIWFLTVHVHVLQSQFTSYVMVSIPNIFMYLGIIAVDVPIFPVFICQLPREKACDLHDQTITFVMPPSYGFKRDFSQLQYTHRTSFFYTSSRVVTMSSDQMKVRFIHHSDVPPFIPWSWAVETSCSQTFKVRESNWYRSKIIHLPNINLTAIILFILHRISYDKYLYRN